MITCTQHIHHGLYDLFYILNDNLISMYNRTELGIFKIANAKIEKS